MQEALARADFEQLDGGRFRVAGHLLEPEDVLVERGGRSGSAIASADGVTVELDTALNDELRLDGRVLDLIRQVNTLRKDEGLQLTDRIVLTLPREQEELLRYADRIKQETLAVEIRLDGVSAPVIAKA